MQFNLKYPFKAQIIFPYRLNNIPVTALSQKKTNLKGNLKEGNYLTFKLQNASLWGLITKKHSHKFGKTRRTVAFSENKNNYALSEVPEATLKSVHSLTNKRFWFAKDSKSTSEEESYDLGDAGQLLNIRFHSSQFQSPQHF